MTDYKARAQELNESHDYGLPYQFEEEIERAAYALYKTGASPDSIECGDSAVTYLCAQEMEDDASTAYLMLCYAPQHLLLECLTQGMHMRGIGAYEIACTLFALMIGEAIEGYLDAEKKVGGRVTRERKPADAKAYRHGQLALSGLTEDDIYRRMQAQITREGLTHLLGKDSDATDSERRRWRAGIRAKIIREAIAEKEDDA